MATNNRTHWPQTLGYFITFVAVGMYTAALGPTLPNLADHIEVPLSEISFLFTAHALGYLLGSLLGGRLYDRMPGHPLMAAMLLLVTAMLALVPLSPTLWLLTAAWLLMGVAGGALDVGGNALMVWVHGRQVGPFMNGLHFFFGAGALLSPIIVALVLSASGGITWAYWLLAILVLPVALWLFRTPSPASPHDEQPSPTAANGGISILSPQQRQIVFLIALLLLLYVGAEASFGGWISTYALALDVGDAAVAAYLTSAFWGALTAGRLLGIPLAARFRPSSILLADLAGCLLSVGVILLWPGAAAATWLGTLGLGFFMASIFPAAISLAGRRIPITGQITGWFLVSASVGAMFLPWLIGQLFEPVGPWIAMAIILFDLAVALGLLVTLRLFSARQSTPLP